MLPPLPRCSSWAYSSLISPSRISLPRKGCRVGLHIVLFEACSAFTRVAACTLARSPIRDPLPEGFRHFVASMPAPVASGWSDCRVGLAPTGKRRLVTAHTLSSRSCRMSGAPKLLKSDWPRSELCTHTRWQMPSEGGSSLASTWAKTALLQNDISQNLQSEDVEASLHTNIKLSQLAV